MTPYTPTHTLCRLNAIFPVSLTSSVQMFGNIIAIPLVDRWLIHYSASVDYNNCTNDNDDGDDNGRDDYDDGVDDDGEEVDLHLKQAWPKSHSGPQHLFTFGRFYGDHHYHYNQS